MDGWARRIHVCVGYGICVRALASGVLVVDIQSERMDGQRAASLSDSVFPPSVLKEERVDPDSNIILSQKNKRPLRVQEQLDIIPLHVLNAVPLQSLQKLQTVTLQVCRCTPLLCVHLFCVFVFVCVCVCVCVCSGGREHHKVLPDPRGVP